MRKPLSIIIPVRREEETIADAIGKLQTSVKTPHTILIADDTVDPSDKTIKVIRRIDYRLLGHSGQVYPVEKREAGILKIPHQACLLASIRRSGPARQVRDDNKPTSVSRNSGPIVICNKKRGDADGFGPALCRAIQTVTTPYTVIVMADLCDDPKAIDRMMSVMQEQSPDVVVGCRYMKEAEKIGGPILQGVLSTLLNALLFWVLRFPTRDSTNAFKLYRTSFLKKILPLRPESGVEFSLQLTIRGVRENARMIDVPTTWRGREKGQSKVKLFQRGPKYLKLAGAGLATKIRVPFP